MDLMIVLIIILILVIMWRGPKTLPQLGEALGRTIREVRKGASEARDEAAAQANATDDADQRGTDGSAPSDEDRQP
jgi:sec-independent protein translocase protein TatA